MRVTLELAKDAVLQHRYVIRRLVGCGGMGAVYEATDLRLRRVVAVKQTLRFGEYSHEEFEREAMLLAGLQHPILPGVSDFFSEGEDAFLVMPFIEGDDLARSLERRGYPFGAAEVLAWADQLLDGLEYLHSQITPVIHRDIKPHNLKLTPRNHIKLLDFGLAKGAPTEMTGPARLSIRAFSLNYAPLEQVRGEGTDASSDLYALAATLYHLLTGVVPADALARVARLSQGKADPLREAYELHPDVPRPVARVLKKALSIEREGRPVTAAAMRQELREASASPRSHRTTRASLSSLLPRRLSLSEAPTTTAADVIEDASVADFGSETRPAPEEVGGNRRAPIARWVGTFVAIAASAATIWVLAVSFGVPAAAPEPVVRHLTSYLGDERFPSFSPDGTQVAFSWSGVNQDNDDIYVKPLGAQVSVRLTTDPAEDSVPAWSPTGGQIAFVRRQGDQAAVYLTPPVPGSHRKLADFRPAALQIGRMMLSWTPDEKWLAIATRDNEGPNLSLLSVADGSQRTLIARSSSEHSYCFPTISPSGKKLAYAVCEGKDGVTTDAIPCDVYIGELAADFSVRSRPRRITHQAAMIQGITWSHDERSVVYGSLFGGDMRLWRVAVTGAPPEVLELAALGEAPSLSRGGDKLAYSRDNGDWDIWRLAPGMGPVAVLSSTTTDFDAQLAPDGEKVAFVSDRSGAGRQIWVSTLDGSSVVPLTEPTGGAQGSPRWSPDARWISFDGQSEDGNWDIYVIDAAGGRPRRLTRDVGFDNFPSWSRDGSWIYFRSTRSGRSEVWKMAPDGTKVTQITKTGGASAWESWDGSTLYYTRHDGMGPLGSSPPVFAQSLLERGAERQIIDGVFRWDFVPAKDGIYHVVVHDRRRSEFELRFLNFSSGAIHSVSRFQTRANQGLSTSADGKTILYSGRPTGEGADLMLIQNFR